MDYTKLLSARWLLTVLTGAVFAYLAVKSILPPDAVAAIITMVFVSYFQRGDRQNGQK